MTDNEIEQKSTEKKDTDLSIGERIQKRRKALELSAEDLVFLIDSYDSTASKNNEKGISLPTIYRYEKGEREPATREIMLLCYSLDVSPNWLLMGEEWNHSQESDTGLADALRSLIKQAQYQTGVPSANASRQQRHFIKLNEVKNRSK